MKAGGSQKGTLLKDRKSYTSIQKSVHCELPLQTEVPYINEKGSRRTVI